MPCFVTVTIDRNDLAGFAIKKRQAYSYACPFDDVEPGDRVLVPFGKRDMLLRGQIRELDPPYDIRKHATKWVAAHVNHRAHDMRTALGMPELTEGEK